MVLKQQKHASDANMDKASTCEIKIADVSANVIESLLYLYISTSLPKVNIFIIIKIILSVHTKVQPKKQPAFCKMNYFSDLWNRNISPRPEINHYVEKIGEVYVSMEYNSME